MTAKSKANEGPIRIPMKFDDAIKRALSVKPPAQGWAAYEKKIKKNRKRRRAKKAA
jgi:hypothetical protein